MLAPGFWDDQRVARRLAREAEGLREELTLWKELTTTREWRYELINQTPMHAATGKLIKGKG
jgi:hypothetical protein